MDFLGQVFSGITVGPHYSWLIDPDKAQIKMQHLDATTADSGSGATGLLRSGLVLGRVTATKKVKQYADGAADGTETAIGVLLGNHYLKDPFGGTAAAPLLVPVVIQARVRASELYGIDTAGKVDLRAKGFIIEDDYE